MGIVNWVCGSVCPLARQRCSRRNTTKTINSSRSADRSIPSVSPLPSIMVNRFIVVILSYRVAYLPSFASPFLTEASLRPGGLPDIREIT
jgi:hypothetical protein